VYVLGWRSDFESIYQDTLGSVGVIVSTVLIKYTGYTVFDPIASLFIAGLIVASVIPLVVDSGRILCLELTSEKATEIRQALAEVSSLEGVASYGAARFWPADESSFVGSIHIQLDVSRNAYDPSRPVDPLSTTTYLDGARENVIYANAEKVRKRVDKALRGRIGGLKELSIQVEGMAPNYCSCTT
jgi:zinc transporter 5/7